MDVAISYAAKTFQRVDGGSLKLDPDMIDNAKDLPGDLRGGQHHCGTTRMSDSPKYGVVDSNLKLFDAHNVFVCGSSVFPTNGWVNPTFENNLAPGSSSGSEIPSKTYNSVKPR